MRTDTEHSSGEATADLVARLAGLDVCVVSDALDSLGLAGWVAGIVPMWEGARVVGRAMTVQLAEGPDTAREPVHLGVDAIMASAPGDVIVVANAGRTTMGSWGGLLSTAAMQRGIAGVVTDGACRDVDEARQLRFPAFARAPVARTARGRAHQVACGTPVSLGDTAVRPEDIVMADGSGVVVLAAEHAAAVVAKAESLVARENLMRDDLLAGVPPDQVLGSSYEHMLR
jgi:4-hydroxy-4-methyl-2-oxoglutarate aldolase